VASLYGPLYEGIWRESLLLPGQHELFASLASEYAAAYGLSQEDAERELELAWREEADRSRATFPAHVSNEELAAYYSAADGIPVALYWHSLRPDRYALHSVAALHAVQQFAEGPRVYEHGHGVGSTAILFERHGLETTLGDVSSAYRDFARTRLEARRLPARFVDLTEQQPEEGAFDAVVSLDVLEHVPDPVGEVRRLRALLRPGGLLALNVAFGRNPATPEHLIARRLGFVDRVRSLGFERIASPSLLVFYRRPLSRARSLLYRVQDAPAALAEDARARWPALAATRAERIPPV
jgi:2-polyprenyl-3-methyl-5-hydroxy-6-metoxy-1,4-benzoquinol methylase